MLLYAGTAAADIAEQRRIEEAPVVPPPPPVLEKPPELLAPADAIFPDIATRAGRGGDVVLRIVIDEEGLVERLDVFTSAAIATPAPPPSAPVDAGPAADPAATAAATSPVVEDPIGRALDWAAMGAATNFIFAPATFCTFAAVPEGGAPEGAVLEAGFIKTCGVPGKVAIDYKTTFAVQEQVVEVPTEAATADVAAQTEGVLNLEGVVREAGTKDPLEDVEVVVEVERPNAAALAAEERYDLRTTRSDAEGRFSMRGIPPGTWRVTFSQSGYEASFVDETFSDKERTSIVVYLQPRQSNKFETVVRRRRAQKDVAKISLSRDEVRRVPGTFGDPLRVIENLPGLARAPFAGGALIVRGANPSDSGVYFDGVPIPILYHFGGLKSVVNAEFLEDISFYPGGFGAYYGRATAGIVDVASRKLDLKSFRGYADVNLLDSGFFFGGPIKVGELPKITVAASARRSYIDALLPFVLDAAIGPGGQGIVATPVYWDYQAKVESTPLRGHRLSLFLFGSDDDLAVIQRGAGGSQVFDIGYHTTFHRLVGRYELQLIPGLKHTLQPFVGLTRVDLGANNSGTGGGPATSIAFGINTWNWGVRDELSYSPTDALTVRAGLDYLGQTFGIDIDFPLPVEIGSFPRVFPRVTGENQQITQSGFINATAFYLEAELMPVKGLKVVPGVRGELTIFTFLPQDNGALGKTDAGEARVFHIDPRLTARYELLPRTVIKGAAGVYRQVPTGQQINTETGNPDLQEPRAVQLIAGVEQGLTRDINLDLQAYFTNRDLTVQSSSETRVADDGSGTVEPLFYNNGGRGRTVGLELLLRHELSESFYGWIAYTLSRTVEDLNENRSSFSLTSFDQTHILTVVAQTNLPYGFTLGGRFRVVSGNPTGAPLGSVHDLDTTNYLSLGSSATLTRLPAFNQLDLRVDRKFVFETFSATAYLDLLNVYNAQNFEGYVSDFRSREQAGIPSLPVLPVLGASGEF